MAPLSTWWLLRRLKSRAWVFKRMVRALTLFLPMTRDVIKGRFRPVPWSAFGLMAVAVFYLVLPFDLIPDFLVLIGVVDDVVIVGWLLNQIDQRLADYRAWKYPDNEPAASPPPTA
ncbi:YkvA family protein [Vreelandella arcis]|uniref:Uncharacterized membrane protein YkvA, DUF1232 family n=1 Tax=Vreelandella arcis TaxID=416873 RepID=A0A1G9ZGR3_9GAMM|nr:DUF1232 domain-containing protein [Halomonas arcis]SDN20211.1 Uncharacterized membrane protein YkvA, DUF1232 family [Halomonas arcis]